MSKSQFTNQVRQSIRLRGYSKRTEKTYAFWIADFIRFHNFNHPTQLGAKEVGQLPIVGRWRLTRKKQR